jgi:hypothetical protein
MSITKLTTNGLTGSKYDTVSADNYYMEPIATNLLASTTASVTFSNIPQNYKHLQLRILGRTDRAVSLAGLAMRFNGDTSTSYSDHNVNGDGATAASNGDVSATYLFLARYPGASATASIFGTGVIDILDYTNVNKYKTSRSLAGVDLNGSGQVYLQSGLWMNTAPITSILIYADVSGSLVANSRFSLYGIKG